MSGPTLLWLRRDLRLGDHPALTHAAARGPVIPVFIRDDEVRGLPAAPALRLEAALEALAARLEGLGSRLILRSGEPVEVLRGLMAETGADLVVWTRRYDPQGKESGAAVKAAHPAESYPGALLAEPWEVKTKTGGDFKVFTPFWRALSARGIAPPRPAVSPPAPSQWPASEALADWHLSAPMNRGRAVISAHIRAGEEAALAQLDTFAGQHLADYGDARDQLGQGACSGLSAALAWGEVSPRQVWWAASGQSGAEAFQRQLAWRDFAWHLTWHSPHMLSDNWREGWEAFPWNEDATRPEVQAWMQGRTGVEIVDAAMRELHVTGYMHNRARMLVASYLTKHLMTHWRIGADFFAEHLVDWDPANNAMGWQWVAGCGPDAAPFFRIFNPETQAQKFDPTGAYRARWLASDSDFFDAVPRRWGLTPNTPAPVPTISLKQGRERALSAYQDMRNGRQVY